MPTIFQLFSQVLISILISVAVWVAFSVSLLSLAVYFTGSGGGFINLTPNLPLSQSAMYGLAVGVVHGLFTGLITYWYKPASVIGLTTSSIFVTEILIAVGFVAGFVTHYLNQPVSVGKPPAPPAYVDYFAFIFNIVLWYIILSILFLIPSIVIALANKPFISFSSK